jgi:VanZ family protein
LIRLVTAGYWVAMCVGTHLPIPPDVVPSNVSDTWLHLAAYFGLAVLLVGSVAVGRRVCRRDAVRLWLLAVCYGALDELTQMIPLLHRTAEWKDLLADAAGAAAGVLTGLVLARAWSRGAVAADG